MCLQVDILHPLATFHWEECGSLPGRLYYPQCVLLHDKLYVANRSKWPSDKLYVSSTTLSSWSTLTTPVHAYALATYHSQLVLVGGTDSTAGVIYNKLWTSSGTTKVNWQPSLPPMPTMRFSCSAVNIGAPELLIVAGGVGVKYVRVDIVEVLTGEQWTTVQPLPQICESLHHAIHNGILYFGYSNRIFHCNVDTLLYTCKPGEDKMRLSRSLWRQLRTPHYCSSLLSFKYHLSIIGRNAELYGENHDDDKIFTLTPSGQSWVLVAKLPISASTGLILPMQGDVLAITDGYRILKGSLQSKLYI